MLQKISYIKTDKDWDFINKESEKHARFIDVKTYHLITEVRKQYIMETVCKNIPTPDMSNIIHNAHMVINNYNENLALQKKGLPVTLNIMADDDRFLYSHLMKRISKSQKRDEIEKLSSYSKLIYNQKLRDNAERIGFFKFMNPYHSLIKLHSPSLQKTI